MALCGINKAKLSHSVTLLLVLQKIFNMSDTSSDSQNQSAFAEALQRAQQIAARINPGASAATRPLKRPLEDYEEPDSKKMARSSDSIPQTDNSYVPNLREPNASKIVSSVIMIPRSKVGLIIGKGGETIKQLQEKSGAKLFIVQDDTSTSDEKPLRVSGEPHKVEYAKELVQEIVGEHNRKGDAKQEEKQHYEYGGTLQIEVSVPRPAVGLVIGKGGDMIKKIQSETGAKVQFHQAKEEGHGDRRCYISGNHQNVERARQRIEEIIGIVCPGRNNGNGDGGEFTFIVPVSKCGIIIGKGGETIKSIIQYSGVHCELDKSYQGEDRSFIIRGDEKQIETAQKMISKKIHMQIDLVPTSAANNLQTAYPSLAMGYYQNWGTPSYEQQQWGGATNQAGQPDYTQQWAEYYRHMAMQPQTAVNDQAASNGSASGADYSFQWMNYYRQQGQHVEADAILQHINAKNSR